MEFLKAPMLKVEALRKSYAEVEAVRDISFEVAGGQCLGLLGPNGAGKTTTLRCCLGLTRPDSGMVRLLNMPMPDQARAARMRVGVVPQFDNLDVLFTVSENLIVFGSYFGLSSQQCQARVEQLLDFAGLADKAHASIDSLSGGMKRRLMLARAMINDPQILFLDEPTTGLDPQARHLVWDRLNGLLSQGRTIVLTSHFMDEVQRLCDRVAIVDRGMLVSIDAPDTLIEREIEPVVIEVFGENLRRWFSAHGQRLASRSELTGDTAFCYCADPEPLLKTLTHESGLRVLRRAANLEDVFLKLTGRDLRD